MLRSYEALFRLHIKKWLSLLRLVSSATTEGRYFSATQWAPTFPNLRRHHTLSVLYNTVSVLPVLSLQQKQFLCALQLFD